MNDAPAGASARREPPLDAPFYGAPLRLALRRFVANYATFAGRASRAEFWWPVLVVTAFPHLVQLVTGATTGDWRPVSTSPATRIPDAIVLAFGLATALPAVAVTWRRLHDTGRSGAWFFLLFVPLVGWIWFLVLVVSPARRSRTRAVSSLRVANL